MTGTAQTNSESARVPHGEQALIASVGGARYFADWKKPQHRLRRLLSEFIGVSGLTFVLSGGAAILVLYGGSPVRAWEAVGPFGELRDLDGVLLLLVSDAGRFMTGTTVVVDRGQSVVLRG